MWKSAFSVISLQNELSWLIFIWRQEICSF